MFDEKSKREWIVGKFNLRDGFVIHELYLLEFYRGFFCFSIAVFATGSRDGHIMIWDARCNKKGTVWFGSTCVSQKSKAMVLELLWYSVYSFADGHISPVNIIRNAHSITLRSQGHKTANRKLGPPRVSEVVQQ